MDFIIQSVVIGLTENAPLVLAAIGFALLYRLTGLINVAYSETITLGAYFGMWLNTTFGLSFYAILIPTGLLAGFLSVATYLGLFRPAKRRNVGVLELIIISFGLSIFLRHGLQFVFGYPERFYDVPPPETIMILGVGVTSFRLLALFAVAALSLLLYLFIQRTGYGLKIRALASDEDLAKVSGIRPLAVTTLIWFVAGVAGGGLRLGTLELAKATDRFCRTRYSAELAGAMRPVWDDLLKLSQTVNWTVTGSGSHSGTVAGAAQLSRPQTGAGRVEFREEHVSQSAAHGAGKNEAGDVTLHARSAVICGGAVAIAGDDDVPTAIHADPQSLIVALTAATPGTRSRRRARRSSCACRSRTSPATCTTTRAASV